jgi:hypothetical protein
VAHGLRHQKVNDVFAEDAGGPSPVRGAEERPPLDEDARRRAAHLLGHSRLQVTNCYLGSAAALPRPAATVATRDAEVAA